MYHLIATSVCVITSCAYFIINDYSDVNLLVAA